jgi:hypothetical protein
MNNVGGAETIISRARPLAAVDHPRFDLDQGFQASAVGPRQGVGIEAVWRNRRSATALLMA